MGISRKRGNYNSEGEGGKQLQEQAGIESF